MSQLADWFQAQIGLIVPLVIGAAALWLMMPRVPERKMLRRLGFALGAASLVAGGFGLIEPSVETAQDVLFLLFGGTAVAAGALTVTNRNPVYAALWFALATLSVCGLFLLESAPFLAAATVIVYAGAIIVTFLFVIMLAQQAGSAEYDGRASQPLAAILASVTLVGGTLYSIQQWRTGDEAAGEVLTRRISAPAEAEANLLSRPTAAEGEIGTMRGLGRSLFGDYLFAVELAGTLLLVAAVGAIAIAPRRAQGNL